MALFVPYGVVRIDGMSVSGSGCASRLTIRDIWEFSKCV